MHGYLTLDERLDVLRAVDTERTWYSLDDKRVCTVCDRIFTGRQIDITATGAARFSLRCPTEDCPSDHRHWFFVHANPWQAFSLQELAPMYDGAGSLPVERDGADEAKGATIRGHRA